MPRTKRLAPLTPRMLAHRSAARARSAALASGRTHLEALTEAQAVHERVLASGHEENVIATHLRDAILLLEAHGYKVTKSVRPDANATRADLEAFIVATVKPDTFDPPPPWKAKIAWKDVFAYPRITNLAENVKGGETPWEAFFPGVLRASFAYRDINSGTVFPKGALKGLAMDLATAWQGFPPTEAFAPVFLACVAPDEEEA